MMIVKIWFIILWWIRYRRSQKYFNHINHHESKFLVSCFLFLGLFFPDEELSVWMKFIFIRAFNEFDVKFFILFLSYIQAHCSLSNKYLTILNVEVYQWSLTHESWNKRLRTMIRGWSGEVYLSLIVVSLYVRDYETNNN